MIERNLLEFVRLLYYTQLLASFLISNIMKYSISYREKSSTTKRASPWDLAAFMLEMPLSLFIIHLNSELITSLIRCAALDFHIIQNLSQDVTYLHWIEQVFANRTPRVPYIANLKRASVAVYVLTTLALNWLIEKLKADQAFKVFGNLSLSINHFPHKLINNIIFLFPYWNKVFWQN